MSIIKGNHGGLGGSGAPGGALGSFYPHAINQSLRFDHASSTVLHRTPSSSSNRSTWSFSCWLKRGKLTATSTNHSIFSAGTNVFNRRISLDLNVNDTLNLFMDGRADGASYYNFITDRVFRDPSAWYHILAVLDTTDSTADDRIKLYVNGEQQSGAYQYGHGAPPQDSEWSINHTYEHDIGDGHHDSVTQHFDGYLAEIHFVDGTALTPSNFGETKDGIWIPKAYSGSHGTNGFHLPFDDSSAIGDDESSNTNDFTPSNLAASDVVLDSPTNNFGVMNVLDFSSMTVTEGGLKVVPSGDYKAIRGNFGIPTSGKWYFEARILTPGGGNVQDNQVGIVTASNVLSGSSPYPQAFTYGVGYLGLGQINRGGSAAQSSLTAFTAGKVLGVAVNVDDDEVQFYLDGSAVGTTHALVSTTEPNFAFYVGATSRGAVFNFGQDSTFAGAVSAGGNADANGIGDFAYAPPSGFSALCTSNLSDPTIGPGQSEQADDNFETVLYAGTGSTQSTTGIFQPAFTWIKARDGAGSGRQHMLFDAVRGATKNLRSHLTNAETTVSTSLTSFNSDGFTIGSDSDVNTNGENFVAWNWKAGTAFSNDASATGVGSLDSAGFVNQAAGFAVIGYTGTIQSGETVAHGLGGTPEMIWAKNRDSSANWVVFTKDLTADRTLYLNLTNGENNSGTTWGNHTSTVFGVDDDPQSNGDGDATIAYLFRSIEGYSKVGKYTGNGSTDGTFVYTGFRPAWIMVKEIGASGYWMIQDNKIYPFNDGDTRSLAPNDTGTESTISNRGNEMDILSNGFKMRASTGDFNASGSAHIYLAFAEAPFKFANAR